MKFTITDDNLEEFRQALAVRESIRIMLQETNQSQCPRLHMELLKMKASMDKMMSAWNDVASDLNSDQKLIDDMLSKVRHVQMSLSEEAQDVLRIELISIEAFALLCKDPEHYVMRKQDLVAA